ncbi:MAG: macrolide ABC transporter ATP-binding protein [Chloroflexi bacterium]|nr:macrolide ABC transporter ATP-binding protein [Chloroflexota bacterium]|tara:strand:+ start:16879 stop:17583 length:705 start_codon:yes stop_codon:yes gene_type:complete
METIISAKKVDKIYKSNDLSVNALNSVTFKVNKGEMVAVMGPSGSGKTTLLNCISGLDSIDSGEITISKKSLTELSDNELSDYRAKAMGFVFQSYNLLPVLNAVENVELPLVLAGVSQKEATRKALEKLDLVGLADRAKHLPTELSGGQQQRVAIARALSNDPAIVWADEPTGNLDSSNASEIMKLLVDLNRKDKQTFVLVTHSEEIGSMANRIIRMSDGKIVDDGTKRRRKKK